MGRTLLRSEGYAKDWVVVALGQFRLLTLLQSFMTLCRPMTVPRLNETLEENVIIQVKKGQRNETCHGTSTLHKAWT
jgi:hypothetical protein